MITGLPSFTIDKRTFALGTDAYNDYPTGGFTVECDRINLWKRRGYLHVPAAITAKSTSLKPSPAISWGYGKGALGPALMAVGVNSSNDADFYLVDDVGVFTKVGSTDTSHDYQEGFTDTAYYNGKFYTTSKGDMVEQATDLTGRDTSFWVTTKGRSGLGLFNPHPLLVYGSIMYIADGQYLHQLDGTTASEHVFNLEDGYVITAMVKYNNLIYIAAEPYYNASGTYHGGQKIFTWNGYADSWLDAWDIGYRVNAMYVYENVLYIWTNDYVGYFNGTIFVPLWPIRNTVAFYSQVFKNRIAEIDKALFYVDGIQLVRLGPIVPAGKKVFTHCFRSPTSDTITGIFGTTDRAMVLAQYDVTAGASHYIADVNASDYPASGSLRRFNPRFFNTEVKIKHIVIEFEAFASGQALDVAYINDAGTIKTCPQINYTNNGAITRYTFDINGHPMTRSCQVQVGITGAVGIRSITVYYQGSELKTNK